MKKKLKIYYFSTFSLMILLSLLRTLALFFSYDTATGYFDTSFLSVFTSIAFAIGTAWCLSPLITFPRGGINTKFAPKAPFFRLASTYSALALILSSALIATQSNTTTIEAFGAILAAFSTLFFVFSIFINSKLDMARAFLSIVSAISSVCIFASLYFDFSIAMNSPHKILGSFALMSAMIFFLCETRIYLGRFEPSKATPRLHLAFSLMTSMLGLPLSISSIIYYLTSLESDFVKGTVVLGNLGYIGVISAVSVYALARCLTFTEALENSQGF